MVRRRPLYSFATVQFHEIGKTWGPASYEPTHSPVHRSVRQTPSNEFTKRCLSSSVYQTLSVLLCLPNAVCPALFTKSCLSSSCLPNAVCPALVYQTLSVQLLFTKRCLSCSCLPSFPLVCFAACVYNVQPWTSSVILGLTSSSWGYVWSPLVESW